MGRRIFITGGKFDKEYQVYFKDTDLPELLNMGRSQAPEIRTLMLVDSLEMTDHDWELTLINLIIVKKIKSSLLRAEIKEVFRAGTILFHPH